MIERNWRVALNALQIIGEQGPGLAMAMEGQDENAAYIASVRALGG